MMRALVIYESMFGNTRDIAQAIATGLDRSLPTTAYECSGAPTRIPADVGLLVAGAPTHTFGLPRPTTRHSAAEKSEAPLVTAGTGLREWLDAVTFEGHRPPSVATFDTKVKSPLPGSAAAKAMRRLRRAGARQAAPPRTFIVLGTTGPLAEGELDAALTWGAGLGTTVTGGRSPALPA
jgi:hypothetical protein